MTEKNFLETPKMQCVIQKIKEWYTNHDGSLDNDELALLVNTYLEIQGISLDNSNSLRLTLRSGREYENVSLEKFPSIDDESPFKFEFKFLNGKIAIMRLGMIKSVEIV